MMKAAREGLGSQAKLIAVTQLTSTSEAQMQRFSEYPNQPAGSLSFTMLRRRLKRVRWCCLLGSGSATHQTGYQSRFYLSDTGIRPAGAAVEEIKNAS